jgi:hypothetical protein
MLLKQARFFLLLVFLSSLSAGAQQPDSVIRQMDSVIQQPDSIIRNMDSTVIPLPLPEKKAPVLENVLKENIFLNSSAAPVPVFQEPHKFIPKDLLFYILAFILLLLGILKFSFSRYFNNLVRVFFNTSLRQNQLTDQLLQAKLPSMLFNLFFVIISGWYLYLLLIHYGATSYDNWNALLVCVSSVMIIYLVKFCTLKFAGWLTGYSQEAETYIFIVFLINKVIAICLVPIVIIIAFSGIGLVKITVLISFIMITVMMLLRFFRSYGLLQTRLKVSGLHFFIYIIGIELLPLLLIYKAAVLIMSKNL